MRVLHVIPSVSTEHGGPSIVLRTMTRALAAAGAQVDVATTDDDGPNRIRPSGVVHEDGVTYRYFPLQLRPYKVSAPLATWLGRRSGDYDVVHAHALFSFAPAAAALSARRRGTPYVVRPLGVLNKWGRHERRPRLKDASFRLVERRILANAAAVHWTSEAERSEAEDLNIRAPGVVIPNPVDDPPVRNCDKAPPIENGRVLFLSRVDEKKGVDLLLEAFAIARCAFPEATLTIAGAGPAPLLTRLKAQGEALGLGSHVSWLGHVSGIAKENAFQQASLVVLPSRSENFGVAAVEAMARALPVVVSDCVGIHGDIVAGGAGLAVPLNAAKLAEAMLYYLRNEAARAAAGKRGVQLVQDRYTPTAVAAQLMALYHDLAAGKRPPLA